jgi:hypothetical protein
LHPPAKSPAGAPGKCPNFGMWNAKFKRGVSNQIHVIGCESNVDIMKAFADKSTAVSCDSMDSGDAISAESCNATEDRSNLLQHNDSLPTLTDESIEFIVQ